MRENVVIIGAGHAGGQAAVALRQEGWTGAITLVGEEAQAPYQRPPLSKKFLTGEMEEARLLLRPPHYYVEHGIEVRTGCRVAAVDPAGKQVLLDDGERMAYGQLILATGARPRRLACPGHDLDQIFELRTIADALRIRPHLVAGRRLMVVGAGYVGLEVAAVGRAAGLDVTVIEAMDRVLARVASPIISTFIADMHRASGVDLRLGAGVAAFHGGTALEAVELSDGTRLAADFAVVGIGVVPNTEIAANAGLAVDNGVVVDAAMRTSDPDIFAVGDVTNHPNPLLGRRLRLESVQNAVDQAKVAASAICGKDTAYAQIPWFWSDQYDVKLQTAGLIDGHDEAVVRGDMAARKFSVAYLKDGRLVALDAVNAAADYMAAQQIIGRGLGATADDLRNPALSWKAILAAAKTSALQP